MVRMERSVAQRCNAESFPSLSLSLSLSLSVSLFFGLTITIQYGVSLLLELSSLPAIFFYLSFSQKVLLPCTILFDMQTVWPTTAPAAFNSIESLIVYVCVWPTNQTIQCIFYSVWIVHNVVFCIHSFRCNSIVCFEKFAVAIQGKKKLANERNLSFELIRFENKAAE